MVVKVGVVKLGLLGFRKGLEKQKMYVDRVKSCLLGECDGGALLLVEHPPVFTIGIRTKGYTLDDEEKLKKTGAEFVRTDRGGLITFHGPGQLVAYPILNLKLFRPSMRWYIEMLEQTVIDLCADKYSLTASRSADTGVWIGDRKICAIGVHGSRFVTSHGLALNCSTDLRWFEHIVPCGIIGKGVTSLTKELDRTVPITEVIPHFIESFSKHFNCHIIESGDCDIS